MSKLGLARVRELVLSAEVFARWPQHGSGAAVDLEQLQLHTNAVTSVTRALLGRSALADDRVLAARLHNIGYWILNQERPRELHKAVDLARVQQISMLEAELEVIGASHVQLGAYLLGIWGSPGSVVAAIAHHHSPSSGAQGGW